MLNGVDFVDIYHNMQRLSAIMLMYKGVDFVDIYPIKH